MSRITQEFYCNDCDGYFFVTLNLALNHSIHLECPNCNRLHPRSILDGVITELSYCGPEEMEKIVVPKSAYHKQSFVTPVNARAGVKVDPIMRARWLETVRS